MKKYTCYSHHSGIWLHTETGDYSLSRYIICPTDCKRKVLHRNKNPFDFRRSNLFCGNIYTFFDDYVTGECFDGSLFKVSIEDYPLVKPYVWHIDKNGYVITKVSGRVLKQHRLIMGILDDPTYEVDHIFHDTTDNRRDKLRLATRSINSFNRRIGKLNTSGTAGVYWSKSAKKWCAQISFNGCKNYLGSFQDYESAVNARKSAEKMLSEI